MLRPNSSRLVAEISRSFDYYQEKGPENKVDRIVLLGGGTELKGLPQFLTSELPPLPGRSWRSSWRGRVFSLDVVRDKALVPETRPGYRRVAGGGPVGQLFCPRPSGT